MPSFADIFKGGEHAHGSWDAEKGAATHKAPATAEDYEKHLKGELGLGLVPVNLEGRCSFAALDLDIDTIDHVALEQKVKARKMPLHVCRSKSGAAHLYVFFRKPRPAHEIRPMLKEWAKLLGHPNCEIFPKQDKVNDKNLGNWINLPYFGGEESTRYCVMDGRALTLTEFLGRVSFYDDAPEVDLSPPRPELIVIQEMPPCLSKLSEEGSPEGTRNMTLLNAGTFYRKAYQVGWEDKVVEHNQKYMKPPLPNREVQTIIKSVAKAKYQYTCDQEPLLSFCDRKTCLTKRYGVGYKPWEDDANWDELVVGNLRKITTKPPRYIIEVNGHDVEMGTDDLFSFARFKKAVFEERDIIIRAMKQDKWEQKIKECVKKMTHVEAPEDASFRGQVLTKIKDFLNQCEKARDRADVLRGVPFKDGDLVIFRSPDLYRYLRSFRLDIDETELYQMIHGMGCTHKTVRLKGKPTNLWCLPIRHLTLQEEDFDLPVIGKSLEEMI